MMGVCRVGDLHNIPGIDATGSFDTFVNMRPVHRLLDVHGGIPGVQVMASILVWVNFRGVARLGDTSAPLNGPEVTCSFDTFIG